MTTIYILRLEGGNYYVGKTGDLHARLQAHMDGRACAWTTKHRVMEVVKTFQNASPFEEDKQVKEYMALYGIQKVRGGTYTQINLPPEEKASLQKEIWGAQDRCTNCGRRGHFVKSCFASTTVDGDPIVYEDLSSEEDYDSDSSDWEDSDSSDW